MSDEPFFTAEDFNFRFLENIDFGTQSVLENLEIVAANQANAKVAPLIAENERLKDANCWSCEDKEKIRKLTEQNRELESIVSKSVPKLEKILSIMKEALEYYSHSTRLPQGSIGMDPLSEKLIEWQLSYAQDDGSKARKALAKVKSLE